MFEGRLRDLRPGAKGFRVWWLLLNVVGGCGV